MPEKISHARNSGKRLTTGSAAAAGPSRYDARRGYPLEYSVDYDREHVDDEGGLTIADFEVIP
ncbi:MAG TPA: DUF6174 domain-containing protein, partial [Longimicrobiaceae bacterium]|nr:DUF6174 domain-containing protein [Longimicrobiaceae bacterium]